MTVTSLGELRERRGLLEGTVGLVPTMGALHAGHVSLIARAKQECDHVVVSIFVNPTQFGPAEDFAEYPRTEVADTTLCREAGVSIVWFPAVDELYPPGAETVVSVAGLGGRFEGESRPGHFEGVATVVTKLFVAVQPDKAFFGQKDLQQLKLIETMTRDLLFTIDIVSVETARDPLGLALSSRNQYLSESQRQEACAIYRGLQAVALEYHGGRRSYEHLKRSFLNALKNMRGAEIERFDLFDPHLSKVFSKGESISSGYCSVAVRYGGVRLIDNIKLCY